MNFIYGSFTVHVSFLFFLFKEAEDAIDEPSNEGILLLLLGFC